MELDILGSFRNKRVLLVGDAILDVYMYGTIVGEALDAPVPEVEETSSSVFFGGNGLVANNILELGGHLTFITIVGADEDAKYYDSFIHSKLKKIFLVDDTRRTTVKRRWYADGKKLLQVNTVDNHNINTRLEKKLFSHIEREAKHVDVIVVMDPQHGLLTRGLINQLKKISKKYKKPMYVDGQISHRKSNHHLYRGVDCILFNEKEARAVYPTFDSKKPEQALRAMLKKLKLKNVVVKLGNRGSVAICNGQFIKSPPYKVKAVDACGAGDAFLAAFSLGDIQWPKETLAIANRWGALSTQIHGTVPPKKKDLIKVLTTKER